MTFGGNRAIGICLFDDGCECARDPISMDTFNFSDVYIYTKLKLKPPSAPSSSLSSRAIGISPSIHTSIIAESAMICVSACAFGRTICRHVHLHCNGAPRAIFSSSLYIKAYYIYIQLIEWRLRKIIGDDIREDCGFP